MAGGGAPARVDWVARKNWKIRSPGVGRWLVGWPKVGKYLGAPEKGRKEMRQNLIIPEVVRRGVATRGAVTMRDVGRADEVRRIEEEIRRLTRRLVELAVADGSEEAENWIGRRVKIIKRDEYFGRIGEVTGLREATAPSWYVELEATRHKRAKRIWKMEKFLEEVVAPDEDSDK